MPNDLSGCLVVILIILVSWAISVGISLGLLWLASLIFPSVVVSFFNAVVLSIILGILSLIFAR